MSLLSLEWFCLQISQDKYKPLIWYDLLLRQETQKRLRVLEADMMMIIIIICFDLSSSKDVFLQVMFQMTVIELVSVINDYHINGLHLFWDTLNMQRVTYLLNRGLCKTGHWALYQPSHATEKVFDSVKLCPFQLLELYIYHLQEKTKSFHIKIMNLFPSCYEHWYESITPKKITRTSSDPTWRFGSEEVLVNF